MCVCSARPGELAKVVPKKPVCVWGLAFVYMFIYLHSTTDMASFNYEKISEDKKQVGNNMREGIQVDEFAGEDIFSRTMRTQ